MFFETDKDQLITSVIVIGILFLIGLITNLIIKRNGRKNGIIKARINLICRYVTVSLLITTLIIEIFVFGVQLEDVVVLFSSVFAILGIALFATWSVLSNVTSGIILFFSYPYKVGDKIRIHDNDLPMEAIIEDIRAFQLQLRLENGDLVTYPNNLILQKPVTLIEKDVLE